MTFAQMAYAAGSTNSVRRRFYRFFQHVTLDGAGAARLVVALLGVHGRSWVLAIDSANEQESSTMVFWFFSSEKKAFLPAAT